MSAAVWGPAIAAAVLSPVLLVTAHTARPRRALRVWLHLACLLAFSYAARRLLDESGGRAALALLASGGIWSGLFWILSIRRRLALRAANGIHTAPPSEEGRSSPEEQAARTAEEEEESAGALEPKEQAILDRLLGLSSLKVSSIAVARERMVTADRARGIRGAIEKMVASGFRRIPMADGSLDRILGVVHAKDIAPLRIQGEQALDRPLKSVMRRALFVSGDRSVAALLEIFRSQRTHLAIVVDEYGRTTGLVSRSDVFRHLVGEGGGAAAPAGQRLAPAPPAEEPSRARRSEPGRAGRDGGEPR
ncbi:MAG: CBS domain-containing protein [Candidatus Eisenbacteria bacterium]